jgi:antirestriction protein ArdC
MPFYRSDEYQIQPHTFPARQPHCEETLRTMGHPSRLARDMTGSFGTKKYAFEELVAEMNAAFCCASLGIVPTVRHADYIGSWLEVLREDMAPPWSFTSAAPSSPHIRDCARVEQRDLRCNWQTSPKYTCQSSFVGCSMKRYSRRRQRGESYPIDCD